MSRPGHTGGTIEARLADNARLAADDTWLISPETGARVGWGEALLRARHIARRLDALGLAPGAPVAIAAQNSVWSTLCFAGIASGGYLATPLNLVAGARVLGYVLGHSGAGVVLCTDEHSGLVDEAIEGMAGGGGDARGGSTAKSGITVIRLDPDHGPDWPDADRPDKADNADKTEGPDGSDMDASRTAPGPDTPALLMYTSGTTGNPKGVVLSHANLLAAGGNVVEAHDITPRDTAMCVLPTYHINGMCVTVMGTLVSRSALVMPYRFSVKAFWEQMRGTGASWFSAVPTLFAYLLNDESAPDIDRKRLRFARSASAPLSPDIHRRFEDRFGLPIIETMGLTETGAQILSNPMPPAARKIGSAGRAVGNEIVIADDRQRELPRGETGEILVRGDNVMRGYLHQEDETRRTVTPEGWLRSGDLGHMDNEGFVFVTGRIKELIIKGGENIAPREVDEVLLEHEAVLEAAAFAVPCREYGQRVEACVRYRDGKGAGEDALIEHCISRLGGFKAPERIHVMEDLPKGPSGKVQRMKLHGMIYPGKT